MRGSFLISCYRRKESRKDPSPTKIQCSPSESWKKKRNLTCRKYSKQRIQWRNSVRNNAQDAVHPSTWSLTAFPATNSRKLGAQLRDKLPKKTKKRTISTSRRHSHSFTLINTQARRSKETKLARKRAQRSCNKNDSPWKVPKTTQIQIQNYQRTYQRRIASGRYQVRCQTSFIRGNSREKMPSLTVRNTMMSLDRGRTHLIDHNLLAR